MASARLSARGSRGLRFEIGLYPTRPVAELSRLAALAESLGFDRLWVTDSPVIWRELWTTLGVLAARTEHLRLGSAVTTGVTRHPAITASAALTLAELTGGRFDLGLGTGDSALVTTGGRPQTLAAFSETVERMRRLLAGEQAVPASASRAHLSDDPRRPVLSTVDTAASAISWAHGPRVPLYIAASGPRMLELAGALADGVIMMVGVSDAMVRAAMDRVRSGARAAGRDPDAIDLVVWTACAVSDAAPAGAIAAVKATVARTVMRTLPLPIAAEHSAAVERIRTGYDYARHSDPRAPHAALVPDQLVADFAVAGATRACAERLRALSAAGVSAVALALPDTGFDERGAMLERLAASVSPAV